MSTFLRTLPLNLTILVLGGYSWVMTAQGINVLGIVPSNITFLEPILGFIIPGIWLAYGLSLANQVIITYFYLNLELVFRKWWILLASSLFVAGFIVFSGILSLFSIVNNKQGEQMYANLRSTITEVDSQVSLILLKAHQEYSGFQRVSEEHIKNEGNSTCRCICRAMQSKYALIQQQYSGTFSNLSTVAAISLNPDEKDLAKLFGVVESKIKELELILPAYSSFLESKKQASFSVSNVGLNGKRVEDLIGYNKKNKFCPAFSETISINFLPANFEDMDSIRSQVFNPEYEDLKLRIESIKARGLAADSSEPLTIDYLFTELDDTWEPEFKWLLFYVFSPDIGALVSSLIIIFCVRDRGQRLRRIREQTAINEAINEEKLKQATNEYRFMNSNQMVLEVIQSSKEQLKALAKAISSS